MAWSLEKANCSTDETIGETVASYRVERGNLGYGVIWEIVFQTNCILRRIAEFS